MTPRAITGLLATLVAAALGWLLVDAAMPTVDVLGPASFAWPDGDIVGAEAVHRVLRGWLAGWGRALTTRSPRRPSDHDHPPRVMAAPPGGVENRGVDDRPAEPDEGAEPDERSDELTRLREEVARLEGTNAALRRRVSLRRALRRGARVGLLVAGCLLAFLAAFAIWTRVVLLDTDRYVDTVAPLAERPSVQKAISDRLGDRVVGAVDLESYARGLLPPRAQPLAGPIATGIESIVRREIAEFVASDRFTTLWDNANRRAHALLIQLLTGEEVRNLRLEGDTVVLDLAGVVESVKDRLRERGLTGIADRIPSSAGRDVPLVQSSGIASAQRAVRVLKGIAIVLPLLALLAYAGYVLLSDGRRRALLRAALALALTMVVLLGFVGLARSAYLDALDSGTLPRQAAADVYDTLLRFLKDGIRYAVVASILVAVLAALFGRPLDRVALSGVAKRAREATWVREHRVPLQLGVAGLGALVLLAWNSPTAGVVLVLFLLVGVAVGLIGALARANRVAGGIAPSA